MITPLLKIKQLVREAGSQKKVAESLCVTPSYLSEILKGTREISEKMALKLGYRKVVTYEPLPHGTTVTDPPAPEGCIPVQLVTIRRPDDEVIIGV